MLKRKFHLKFHLKEFIQRKPKTLAFKIPFAYFVIILLTVAFSALVLNRISENDAQQKINEASLQTITSIQTNVNLMIENVNNYSKMIFSDPNLQNLLRQGNVYSNLQTQSKVSSYLTNLMQAVPIIDSVYIYDNSGHRFSVGTQEWPMFLEANVQDAPWYEQALNYKGRYVLRLNDSKNEDDRSNSREEEKEKEEGENVVSFIRLIRDLDDTAPLGFLVMNIKEKSIAQAYANLSAPDSFQVAILDEHLQIIATNATSTATSNATSNATQNATTNNSINTASTASAKYNALDNVLAATPVSLASPKLEGSFASQASMFGTEKQTGMHEILETNQVKLKQAFQEHPSGSVTLHSGGQDYAVTYRSAGDDQWKYISMSPYRATDTRNKSLVLLALMLLAVNGSVFFISSFIISRSVIKPIHKLLRSMQKAPSGNFRKVQVELNSYEFEQLYSGYNQMIEQIEEMLRRMIQEQQTIRRAELNTLQAQIKPHFLYNTLDSITSLAMSGMNDKVCEMLEALGSYYRLSVSKGNEVITLREEVEIVRHYLTIQQVRYPGVVEVQYDIDSDCAQVMIPKLVLQPLVENSLYHGIRAKGSPGMIRIEARLTGDVVMLTLADDGVGMSEEQVQQIQLTALNKASRPTANMNASFGLWGTMERLRIFYDREDGLQLESVIGKGTTITIIIPKGEAASWNNNF
ncbi:hypothetical protein PAECIP112173_04448 [Paenibacillus sp. JJ-100]|uniref:cache domain-containing sensor histidine kinase n=1 Tax=Paenibacillus sp. JJ-100 TaxID=2974896 RepID=UPI0022FFAA82|nr:sensor histidine kinase [Paenibacillus sp. JJ-100]CAI6084925.1 hypothetical protein PAECIP112173_04448 [Paenibacillus sp. JJ-100]